MFDTTIDDFVYFAQPIVMSDNTLTKFQFAVPQTEAPFNVSYSFRLNETNHAVLEGDIIIDNNEEAFNRFMRE